MGHIFVSDIQSLFRILVVGVLAYIALLLLLRISGNRTLSKMNAFDLVVTVALGSTFATVLLSESVSLAEGALAFALLVGLQFAVTWCSVRARWIRLLVTGEPVMLLHRGTFLPSALQHARVTQDEILAAIRAAGLTSLEDAEAVVLETNGSFSVVFRGIGSGQSSLDGLRDPEVSSNRD